MYPGLSDADRQVAAFHYQQLVDEGQRQQVSAGVRPASTGSSAVSIALWRQLATRLALAGRRTHDVLTVTRRRVDPASTRAQSAIA
jgi:hypothetical protein